MSNREMANVILLSAADNVVVACEQINAGASFEVDDTVISVQNDVALGHKIARQDIAADDKILKYGAPIGRAVVAIPMGGHVHIHNIESDYLHSHTERHTARQDQEGEA
jgi:(2R)-sulfolactate sulfo-lyase subunit alpha